MGLMSCLLILRQDKSSFQKFFSKGLPLVRSDLFGNAISLLRLSHMPAGSFVSWRSSCGRSIPLSSPDSHLYTLPVLLPFASVNLIFCSGFSFVSSMQLSIQAGYGLTHCILGVCFLRGESGRIETVMPFLLALGGGVEEQEENSLATILVRAISDEAVQFSQALRGCTNLTRQLGNDSLRQGWRQKNVSFFSQY